MGKVYTKDIDIYYIDEYEIERRLPCAFYESKPRFRWTLPRGVIQKGFIFEMRTRYPKNYTVLGEEVNRCGYMYSGMQNSAIQEYQTRTSIIYKEMDGIQTDSTYDTWHGTCEVRLRVFGTDGNEYSTHSVAPYTTTYDFEIHADGTPNGQNRMWGSKNNAYYFCFDPQIDTKFNVTSANLVFNSALDADNDNLSYELQVSDMPLFNEGVSYKTFHDVKNINMHDINTSVQAVFGDSVSESPEAIRLEYRKTYYCRARSYDSYDYSDWSTVNAFSVIDNALPTGFILDVSTPMTVDSLGNTVVAERPNGEMNVTFRVNDENDRHVSAWLMFSMPTNISEAEKLTSADNMDITETVQTVDVNESSNAIAVYDENNRGKFLRALTKESLVHIPTNRDITVTWHTINDISKDVMRGKVVNDGSLYMYLFVDDGYGVVRRSEAYRVSSLDNSSLIIDNTPASLSSEIKIRGGLERNLRFPVLPEDMLRQHIVHSIDKDEDEDEWETSQSIGSVGYTENIVGNFGENQYGGYYAYPFTGIYDFYNRQDDILGYNYLQRITQDDGFVVKRYQKYNIIYNESVVKTTSPISNVPGDEYIRKSGTAKIYDENGYDQNGVPASGEDITYIDEDQIACAGFVSFCPYCNELHVLKNGVKKIEWDVTDGKYVSRLYWGNDVELPPSGGEEENSWLEAQKPLLEAFMDVEGESTFDGTPYELVFKCDGCGNIFPMDTKYQKNLSYGLNSLTLKDQYSYWHGHNSDMRLLDNEGLQAQLMLTRKKDFETLVALWVEQWMLEHNGEEPKEEDCPYTWVQTGKINFAQLNHDKDETGATPSANEDLGSQQSYNTEIVGLMPNDALLNLNPRPEFESYMKIVPPVALSHKNGLYVDGAKLNSSIEHDYMHDYKPQDGGEPGDQDLIRLMSQGPWWYQPKMTYHHYEGKEALEDANDGYEGVVTGNESSSTEEETDEVPSNNWSNGIKEYKVLARTSENGIQNHGVKLVVKDDDPDHVVTLVINRMSCSGILKFPIIIERGKNDRYSCIVNGELLCEGSLLEDDEDVRVIEFPYVIYRGGATESVYTINRSIENELVILLMKIFGAFDINTTDSDVGESVMPYRFTRYKSGDIWTGISNDKINFDGKAVSFTVYGKTEVGLDTISSGRYEKFEIKRCENSCYELFGITTDITYQNSTTVFGSTSDSPWLRDAVFPANPTEKGAEPSNATYAYTERNTTKHKYDVQESPIDNKIEDFISYERTVEGVEEPQNGVLRKLSVQPATGEPLFTCYKDEVDADGYHFKFTEEDYRKTGKIYIRKYHVETCNPFPLEGYGYRNWVVVPIEGKPGRYSKQQVFNQRGATAEPRTILVELSSGADPVQDIGWFKPDGEDPATMYEGGIYVGNSDPFSHVARDESSSSSGGSGNEKPKIYKRKSDYTWRNKTMPKTCVVFDYVDITEAMCKNPLTPAGESPLNHVAPINFHSGIFNEYIDRYGIYVLGGYDLTDDQKLLQNDNLRYTKEFPWVDANSGIETMVEVNMPNNWRPEILRAGFDAVEGEKRTINCINLKTGDSAGGTLYTTKSIDSYARFKKAWKGRIPTLEGHELSQYTVEQFNPALKYSVGIWEKWGYQPKNHVEKYWKKDEGAMYSGKYIPASSRIVHGIYIDPITGVEGDPFADERLRGEIMRERHIISDRSLMKEREDYDGLPYLDYRLTGKISQDIMPYFSGYPRAEHPAYENRPEPPYPYDRQWRIGGYREFERDSFEAHKDEELFEMVTTPGAQIGELSTYSTTHSFLYLQDEWNGYNRLHWSVDVGKSVLLCLSACEVVQGTEVGSPFSVKTNNSFWNEDITIDGAQTAGAWCIKYNKSLSDTIDMYKNVDESGNHLFNEHSYYRFKLNSFSVDGNGTITAGDTSINSPAFTIYREAVSPATIIGTNYDPWTKILTINFRFDDALGRNYDIVGFKYITNDSSVNEFGVKTYISENDFVVPGGEGSDGTGVLIGNLYDLESNRSSLSFDNDSTLKTHSLQVKIDSLGIQSTADMRVILLSALSTERMGLTLPVFTVKMWANEFMKPVEEQIMSLQGYKSHWKWVETYDEETGEVTGEWEYLEGVKAIPVMGKIQETQGLINEISDKFDNWFANSSKLIYSDIDAFEHWLKSKSGWNEFYYSYIFQTFLNWHQVDGYGEEYMEYISTLEVSLQSTKARRWLEAMGHAEEYKLWYAEYRFHFLASYRHSLSVGDLDAFESWVKTASSVSDARIEFAEANLSAYKSYYGIVEEENESSSSSSSNSSSSSFVITDAEALEFIEESGLENNFILFFSLKNMYADTRFLERALTMSKKFGVTTAGIWEKQHASPPYVGEYQNWLINTDTSAYGTLNASDLYQMFLITMGCLEKKTDIIPANEETFPVDEEYAHSVTVSSEDANAIIPTNFGRASAFSDFLRSPSGNGTSYGQKWQALNNTLAGYNTFLYQCLGLKNKLETDFRRSMIRQGYFCNGFLNNRPYSGEETNTCFRWRVETRQYEGKTDMSETDGAYGSYDTRYDMYYHFQMDFFDTFNSQTGGKPAKDIIFIGGDETDDSRILAGIDSASGIARTTPYEADKTVKMNDIPTNEDLVVDRSENEKNKPTKDTSEITGLQFSATFSIEKEDLPKVGSGITVPTVWKQAWTTDEPRTEAPDDNNYVPSELDYKSTYYWRVAPYNMVDRPIFDAQLGMFSYDEEGKYAILENIFHADDVDKCLLDQYNSVCIATSRRDGNNPEGGDDSSYCPKWQANSDSMVGDARYKNNDFTNQWINRDVLDRGDVQFVTDRPRKVEYVPQEGSHDNFNMNVASYFITNENGCKLDRSYYGSYESIYSTAYGNDNGRYIFKGTLNEQDAWFIGTQMPEEGNEQNCPWVYYTLVEFPDLATSVYDSLGTQYVIKIVAKYEEAPSSSSWSMVPAVSFIEDNIGNYNTQWIPAGVTRKKPCVIRLKNQYLMFTNKQTSTVRNDSQEYKAKVITVSRGFSSNLFGEEGMCIPRYTVENLGDYVSETIIIGGRQHKNPAVSLENPSVVNVSTSMWRMYFNAVFYENGAYVTKLYKADTMDFDSWFDIAKVTVTKESVEKFNYLQPNVNAEYNQDGTIARYIMFASSTDHYITGNDAPATGLLTIKRLESADGINFEYQEEIYNSTYGYYDCCSPCLVKLGESNGVSILKLYFSIESRSSNATASVIVSLEGEEDSGGVFSWNSVSYLNRSNLILEKGNDNYTATSEDPSNINVVAGKGRVFNGNMTNQHYADPFVLWDIFNGCLIQRMYYNAIENPYLWENKSLTLKEDCHETVIKTEYFEEYRWTWFGVESTDYSNDGGSTWSPLPSFGSTKVIPASSNGGVYARFKLNENSLNGLSVLGIMKLMEPYANVSRCMAQGEWIGYDNVANTEALLLPESNNEIGYSLERYSPTNWIIENGIYASFTSWMTANDIHPETTSKLQEKAIEWLIETRNYPRYLWWSRKGAGIYRYLGYNALSGYVW